MVVESVSRAVAFERLDDVTAFFARENLIVSRGRDSSVGSLRRKESRIGKLKGMQSSTLDGYVWIVCERAENDGIGRAKCCARMFPYIGALVISGSRMTNGMIGRKRKPLCFCTL